MSLKQNGNIKTAEILKCLIVENDTVFIVDWRLDKGNSGGRATSPIGQCGQLPRVIKFFKFCLYNFKFLLKNLVSF
jgi:hypothetical protein